MSIVMECVWAHVRVRGGGNQENIEELILLSLNLFVSWKLVL